MRHFWAAAAAMLAAVGCSKDTASLGGNAALSGTVALGSPAPQSGLVVTLSGPASATPDDAGGYSIAGVPVGTWDVIASAPGYRGAIAHAVQVGYAATASPAALQLASAVEAGAIHGVASVTGAASSAGLAVTLLG